VVEDGQIHLTGLPYKRGDLVEVIILHRVSKTKARLGLIVHQLPQSRLISLWKDRNDIENGNTYA